MNTQQSQKSVKESATNSGWQSDEDTGPYQYGQQQDLSTANSLRCLAEHMQKLNELEICLLGVKILSILMFI